MKTLYIIGAGGHGKVAADCAEAMGCFDSVYFLDDGYPDYNQALSWKIVGKVKDIGDFRADGDSVFFVAIGDCFARAKVIDDLIQKGIELTTLIHPSAVVSRHAEVGVGTLICANATVNIAAKIGQGCIINTAASVDHDCTIVQYAHIAPGVNLAGTVTIGEKTFVGVGSAVAHGIHVGNHCIIGGGAAVVTDIPANSLAVGVPAKVKKSTISS